MSDEEFKYKVLVNKSLKVISNFISGSKIFNEGEKYVPANLTLVIHCLKQIRSHFKYCNHCSRATAELLTNGCNRVGVCVLCLPEGHTRCGEESGTRCRL